MKINVVQLRQYLTKDSYFVVDHLRLFYHALKDLGHCVDTPIMPQVNELNIIWDVGCLGEDDLKTLLPHANQCIVVTQAPYCSISEPNNWSSFLSSPPSKLKALQEFLGAVRGIWTPYSVNVDFLSPYNQVHHYRMGHHPILHYKHQKSEYKWLMTICGQHTAQRAAIANSIVQQIPQTISTLGLPHLHRDATLHQSLFQLVLPFDFNHNFYNTPLEACTGFFHNIPTLFVQTPFQELDDHDGFKLSSLDELLPKLNEYLHKPRTDFEIKRDLFLNRPFSQIASQLLEQTL
ncbi:MAG: hypothetical protein CMK59_08330 [Proteobacteria bacterium]|nr:hypothetical protein [Pseudomonadota bacterium]